MKITTVTSKDLHQEDQFASFISNCELLNFGKLGIFQVDRDSPHFIDFIKYALTYANIVGDKEEVIRLTKILQEQNGEEGNSSL